MKSKIGDWAFFGGEKVFDRPRTTQNLALPDEKSFFENIRKSFAQNQFSNNGPCVKQLEAKLAEFHETKYCIVFCNCFTGMYLGLRYAALPGKTEVIMPAFSDKHLSDIVRWAGFLPKYCEVEEETLAMSPKAAEDCINEKTALILASHPVTRLCNIERMEDLSAKSGIPVFFESAEACGGNFNGRPIGGFGIGEAFSLHASMIFNGAEGGYITTNNRDFAQKLAIARAFGFCRADEIVCLGANAKMNELHAALALASFSGKDALFAENRRLHMAYQENFRDVPCVSVIAYDEREKSNWKSLLLKLHENWPLTRSQTLKLLAAENIDARPYSSARDENAQGENEAGAYVLLPFGSTMNDEDAYVISRVFKDMFEHGGKLKSRLS